MATWDDYKKTFTAPLTLTRAAKENDLETLRALLNQGLDINLPDSRGYTPVMLAAYNGHWQALELLILAHADLDKPDLAGNSPLMGVVFKGYVEIAEKLIAAGARLKVKNRAGQDAFDIASIFGRKEILALLYKNGISRRKANKFISFLKFFFAHLRSKF